MQKIIRTDDHQIWRAIRCHETRQSSDLMDFADDGLPWWLSALSALMVAYTDERLHWWLFYLHRCKYWICLANICGGWTLNSSLRLWALRALREVLASTYSVHPLQMLARQIQYLHCCTVASTHTVASTVIMENRQMAPPTNTCPQPYWHFPYWHLSVSVGQVSVGHVSVGQVSVKCQ